MKVSQAHQLLCAIRDNQYNDLKTYLEAEQVKNENHGYVRWMPDEDLYYPKFRVGDRDFILKAEIKASVSLVVFRTYEIVLNPDSFPNTKLQPIESMDIKAFLDDLVIFNVKKEVELFPGKTLDATVIREFGKDYIRELINHIVREEKAYQI